MKKYVINRGISFINDKKTKKYYEGSNISLDTFLDTIITLYREEKNREEIISTVKEYRINKI